MYLCSRGGGKGGRRSFLLDIFLCVCLVAMKPAIAEEYSHFLQNTGLIGDSVDLMSSQQDVNSKRSSSFFPLRGKKSSLDSSEISVHYPLLSNQQLEDKRSQFYPLRGKKIPSELKRASYFMPMRGRKDDQEWSEEDKRMSSFMAMRGRKDGEDGMGKRMSSFMPMRGRKDADASSEEDGLDKRMSSFMPMRGRKDDEDGMGKRMSSFMPMRGRKDDDESSEEDNLEKRMSSFMPMRGRKSDEDNSLEKRMPSFMPMRGKKKSGPLMDAYAHMGKSGMYTKEIMKSPSSISSSSGKAHPYFLPDIVRNPNPNSNKYSSLVKSASTTKEQNRQKRSLSFIPMRGKRSIQNEYLNSGRIATKLWDSKRSSFMEMKDKIRPNESFPFDLADGDIGPKSVSLSMLDGTNFPKTFDNQAYDDSSSSTYMPMRRRRMSSAGLFDYDDILNENKRRSRFMPMRGRREFNVLNHDVLESNLEPHDQSKKSSYFMAMRGRRAKVDVKSFTDNNFLFKLDSLMPLWISGYRFVPKEDAPDNQSVETFDNLDDKRASYFMPMRGRRTTDYFYHPYIHHFPSGIGSSLMTRYFGGKVYPVSPKQNSAIKYRKFFDFDSSKRAFHATRGKRYGAMKDLEEELRNIDHQVPSVNAQDLDANNYLETGPDDQKKWNKHEESSGEQESEKEEEGCRCKRNILRPRMSMKNQRHYLALKRPMSFFATRGKRFDSSSLDPASSKFPLD